MTDIIDQVRDTLLSPAELDDSSLDRLMSLATGPGVDYADLYFQFSREESWSLEEGEVKSASHAIDQGVGVRAVSGDKTGFAYSDDIVMPALIDAAQAARAISRQGGENSAVINWRKDGARALYRPDDPLSSLGDAEKVALLEQVEAEARAQDPRVKEVMASVASSHEIVMVVRNDGHMAADIRPLVRLNVSVVVEQNGLRERASAGGGGRYGYDYFMQQDRGLGFAREAVRQALVNLEAKPAPAGTMPVVLGPGWPGVLLHEAVGHGLEGDFNRKETSAFAGRIGEQVASSQCTVVDDGTMENRRGSLSVDDEGTPTESTVLIENGILVNYLQDLTNARLMGMKPTGNGRRESFAHLPMPRMTNTYMLSGGYAPGEIIESVDNGIYAVNFSGGQVDITSGKFVFSTSEAYMIEGGKVTHPVKGATLIGNGPEVMTIVSMVGDDMELDTGVGVCGKEGQSVPVGVGQPTLKVDALTVGGVLSE